MRISLKITGIFTILVFLTGCAGPKPKKDKITVWHWMNDRKDAFSELAERYQAETGIEVEFKLFSPPGIYSQKVIAAARSGNLPDVFGILGEKRTLTSFIKAGHVTDLTPYMNLNGSSWKNKFYPQTLKMVAFNENNIYKVKPGIYGVPIDTTVMQFVYNKKLLRQAGFDPPNPPKSFDEFISMAKIAKEKLGVVGFICGWGEKWLLNALATEWAINLMGESKFLKTIKGEVAYTDSDWIKVLSLFKELKDSGVIISNIANMTNKESEDVFSREKAVFSFNGSWSVNVYRQLNPDLDYAFFSLPRVSISNPLKVWGGSSSSFMAGEKSKNKEKTIKFLQWLTSQKQQKFLIRKTNNLPSIKGCKDQMPTVLVDLVATFGNFTHPDMWPMNEDTRVLEVLNEGLQQITLGLKTPEQVAVETQDKKERILKR